MKAGDIFDTYKDSLGYILVISPEPMYDRVACLIADDIDFTKVTSFGNMIFSLFIGKSEVKHISEEEMWEIIRRNRIDHHEKFAETLGEDSGWELKESVVFFDDEEESKNGTESIG